MKYDYFSVISIPIRRNTKLLNGLLDFIGMIPTVDSLNVTNIVDEGCITQTADN